jgi:hypothetical protein
LVQGSLFLEEAPEEEVASLPEIHWLPVARPYPYRQRPVHTPEGLEWDWLLNTEKVLAFTHLMVGDLQRGESGDFEFQAHAFRQQPVVSATGLVPDRVLVTVLYRRIKHGWLAGELQAIVCGQATATG